MKEVIESDSDYREDQFEGGEEKNEKADNGAQDESEEDSDESYYREYERLKAQKAQTMQ